MSLLVVSSKEQQDSQARFGLTDDGVLSWGSGSAAPDTLLSRTGAGQVTLTGTLVGGLQATAPSIGSLASGFSAASLSAASTDLAGQVTFTAATSTAATNAAVPIVFGLVHGAAPKAVTLTPANAAAVGSGNIFMVRAADLTATGFNISTGATSAGSSTPYVLNYAVEY